MRILFFDIDNTLVDYSYAEQVAAQFLHRSYADCWRISEESFLRDWRISTERNYQRYLSGELGLQEQRRLRIRAALGRGHSMGAGEADRMFAEYLECYEENWRLFPDVVPALEALRDFPMGVISNGDSDQQRRKLTALGIAGYFKHVLVSGDIGIPKPDRRIFEEAARMFGQDAAGCVYVGDHLDTDVRAARVAGFEAYWIVRSPTLGPDNCASVPSLEVLARHMSNPGEKAWPDLPQPPIARDFQL